MADVRPHKQHRPQPKDRTMTKYLISFPGSGEARDKAMSESEQEISVSENEVIPSDFVRTYPLPESKKDGPPRHIFIFLDGTWNEERTPIGLATPTNVLRMYQEMNLKPPETPAKH